MEITERPKVKINEMPIFQITVWQDENGEACTTTMIEREFVGEIIETIAGICKGRDYFGNAMKEALSDIIMDKIMEEMKK